MLLLVSVSAITVVNNSHKCRHAFNDLQQLKNRRNAFEVEWGQLLLEQSTWASQGRIESIASSELNMKIPLMSEMIVVK